ncbi:hypothetical protein K7G98_10455 [Saccharothrix sp. MB29]|nr:hypothetical protein [Saccharothrix sp. MB29]
MASTSPPAATSARNSSRINRTAFTSLRRLRRCWYGFNVTFRPPTTAAASSSTLPSTVSDEVNPTASTAGTRISTTV